MTDRRASALRITLTPQERLTLEQWLRQHNLPAFQARRARAVLLVADGCTIKDAARQSGLRREKLYVWLYRFQAERVSGLISRPRTSKRSEVATRLS